MCGIIGIVGTEPAAPRLLDGLKRLEYRGYDSAGIATLSNGHIERRRAPGKLDNLAHVLDDSPLAGATGIGHTRWATHGAPTENNAHPHGTPQVTLVHNGIIENYLALRERMAGYNFETDTDTEVVAVMLTAYLAEGMTPFEATRRMLGEVEGAFALGIIFAGHQGLLICARRGCPLAIGHGNGEMYIGSDALALAMLTDRISYLDEGDWAVLTPDSAQVYDADGQAVERPVKQSALSGAMIGKGNYRHFMEKEIHEQAAVIGDTLQAYVNSATQSVTLPPLPFDLATIPRLTLSACGTAFYACMVAKYWFEQIARLPVEVDIASEFRYREAPMPEGGAAVFVSQSGETADTLAALQYCRSQGQHIMAVVNVPESSTARAADVVLPTYAGPEIGVASTKAFTTQLTVLGVLAIATARARGAIGLQEEARLAAALTELPARIADVLNHDSAIQAVAPLVAEARDVLYLGRGLSYPIAMEGALKLKEISYIHAEGYAAGEMKHGPIALIDDSVPVIVIAPHDAWFDKTLSNVQETIARGGKVILFSDQEGVDKLSNQTAAAFALPPVDALTAPILYTIPVQLLAYHTAVLKGTDVDQPRNLAKSVTVE